MEQSDEISLLDLLVIIAENWLWLFLVPLAVGAVTFAVLQAQPQHYRASAGVVWPAQDIMNFIEDDEVMPFPQIELASASGQPGLFVSSDSNGTSTLAVTLPSPDEAQATLQAVLDALEQAIAAGAIGHPTQYLDAQIGSLEATMGLRERVAARLEQSLDEITRSSPFEPESYALTANALAQILNGRSQDIEMIASLRAELAASQPTDTGLAVARTGRSPVLISVLAILASGFVMLIAVFIVHGLKSASRDPGARPKLERIRNAFLLRRRPKRNDS